MSLRQRIQKILKGQPISKEVTLAKTGAPRVAEESKDFWSILEERIQKTVSRSSLARLYNMDGLTFRLVQDYIDFIIGPGYFLEGDTQNRDYEKWCKEVHLRKIIKSIILDILVYGAGNAWVELGYNSQGNDILGLRIINPDTEIDYIRDEHNNVKLDSNGDPIGFIQKQGIHGEVVWKKDEITVNGKVVWSSKNYPNQDGRDRIAHFTLFQLGESYLGMTPLSTAYKQAIIRLNLEENVGESAFRSGGIIATIGDPDKPPEAIPDKWVEDVVNELEDVSHKTIFGFKPNVKIDRFPSPELTGRAELIYTFADMQSTAMGRPLILLLHSTARRGYAGEAQQKGVDWELRIASLQEDLALQIEEKFLKRLAKARGYSIVPKFHFKTKTPSILRDRTRAIATLARRNLIKYDPAVSKRLLEELGLPTDFVEVELKKWKEEEKTPIETKEQAVRSSEIVYLEKKGKE